MAVITITSDWNKTDYYLPAVKGELLKTDQGARIVDLNHQITPFNSAEAALIIANSFRHFPQGSIHLVFVDAEPSKSEKLVALYFEGHYFLGKNNGLFSLIIGEKPYEAVHIEEIEPDGFQRFPGLFSLTSAAHSILKNKGLGGIKGEKARLVEKRTLYAAVENNLIMGSVLHIDSYGNIMTNIDRELFLRTGKEKEFELSVQSTRYRVKGLSEHYNEVPDGELAVVVNSSDMIEIAINKGSACKLLKMNIKSDIRIEFI